MPIPQSTEWPTTESDLLSRVVDSLRSRSKALNHRTKEFRIEIVLDGDAPGIERLNLELRSWSPNPERLAISIWEDGVMWLDSRRPSNKGWGYEFSFTGDCLPVSSDNICQMIEQSLWIKSPTELQTIWTYCNLKPA